MCTIIMLFIFFNGGGVFKEMWYEHHGIHSSLINNVETYGNVYLYDPKTTITKKRLENFTNSSDNFLFTVNDLDIEHHCIQLYDEVKTLDDEFILISHSRGYMFANVFANMYYNNVKAHINIDGGKTREEFKKYLKSNKKDMITEENLLLLQTQLKTTNVKEKIKQILKQISNAVTYHTFLQYEKTFIEHKMPYYILNNIYNDDEINISNSQYVRTTLKYKFDYNKLCDVNRNTNVIWYVGKTHWLFQDEKVSNDILNIIKTHTH